MDAVVFDKTPRIIDYKYASWSATDEKTYRTQLAVYCLAVMQTVSVDRACGELWFLKGQMKVVRFEYTRDDAEAQVRQAIANYIKE